MSSYADIPTKRIEAHSRTCASVTLLLLRQILGENKAADRCLSTFLRQNHQFGSRDRRNSKSVAEAQMRECASMRLVGMSA